MRGIGSLVLVFEKCMLMTVMVSYLRHPPGTVFFTSSPLLILEKEWEKGEAENSEPSGQKRGRSVPNVLVVVAALRKSK